MLGQMFKVLEFKSFCIFSCILIMLIILIKPLTTKAYDRRASGDCGTSGISQFLYARLQTGRIMVWWCPSGSPSVRPSVRLSVRPSDSPSVRVSVRPFSALFSYMLWHIELKFCTWLCFNVLQIKFECLHSPSIFDGVMPLCELRI